jgi:polyhydroxyalkanoate synthase
MQPDPRFAGLESRDSYAATAFGDIVDRSLHAAMARSTGGLSPAAMTEAYMDWAVHLANSPGKRLVLADKAMRKWTKLAMWLARGAGQGSAGEAACCIQPLPQDRRFRDPAWNTWPFNLYAQSFLLQQQWWHNATTGVRGVGEAHEDVVAFTARQLLDTVAPTNFLATNPLLLQRTLETSGLNLAHGLRGLFEDWQRSQSGAKPEGAEAFRVGENVAASPGKVILRNGLMELIQYAPTTVEVRPEPIVIVPAWIMKYYILDLSAQNSLVKYLTDQGFTVFMISWKNPTAEDRDLDMEDYRTLGVLAAVAAATQVTGSAKVHAVGYCIGGTLLAIAATAMARDGDERLASITFFATQTDFTEAGELMLFINESQLSFLEDMMWEQGFLDAKQMAGAFQLLRSNDLVWSHIINERLMDEPGGMNDLMAWNADTTRMPYRMHRDYLRHLFLHNDLAEGRWVAGGLPVALSDIRAPIFTVGTTSDHVAPWHSVFKIHLLTETAVTFLLTSGGHNAGIISEPGHPHREFQMREGRADERYVDPETWQQTTPKQAGSWWPAWVGWLGERSAAPGAPPPMGDAAHGLAPLYDAPGQYVMEA